MIFNTLKTKNLFVLTKKATLLSLMFLATTLFAQQNTGTIKGKVQTSDNQAGEAVTVTIIELKKSTSTDTNGNFIFNKVPTGKYQLQITLLGHQPAVQEIIVSTNETSSATFQLASSSKELNEVVVTSGAKKFAEKKSEYVSRLLISNLENPQVYTVVPKELFQEQIAVDFKSALNTAPGLSNVVQSVGSGGVGLSIRMRGFSGASAAGSIRNGMNTNWVTLSDPVNLESIEVIKGPSATLFGSALTTYGGLINRVTKKPFEATKGEVSYTTGSWALSRTTIDFNTALNEDKTMLFRINAALDNQKTWQDYGKSKTFVVTPSFSYKLSDKFKLDFELEMYNGSRNSISIGLGSGTPKVKSLNEYNFDFKKSYATDDLQSEAKNTNVYSRATYLISDKWVSQTNFSNSFTDNKANYLFLLINTAGNTTLQRRLYNINSVFKTSQLQQNFIGNLNTGSVKHRLLVGLDYTYISTNDNRWLINNYDTSAGNAALTINGNAAFINMEKYKQMIAAMTAPSVTNNRDFRTTSAYVSDVVNFTDKLIGMASVRFDHYENKIAKYNQNTVSPKMGLIYQVVKDKVSIFGNYMNGFSNVAPAITAESPTVAVEFDPEQANQLEAGAKFELLGGKLNGTLSYYNIKVKDKVRTDPTNSLYSIQDGTQSSKGFEADLIANPFRGFHIIMGYGYNESEFTKAAANIEGKKPNSTPANVANLWMSYKILDGKVKGLGFGFGGNTQSDSFLNDTNTLTTNGYTVMDASIFYEKPKFRLGLKLNNIANKEYWSADNWATMMPTRQLVANLTYKF